MGDFKLVKLLDPISLVNILGGLVPRGAYNPATDYVVGDSVDYNGSSYVMYVDGPAGTLPTNTTYWQVVANKGNTGTAGSPGTVGPPGPPGANGLVTSIVGGTNVTVDNTTPSAPIINSNQVNISGNAATVTTNANLTGDVTSVGNVTTYNNTLPTTKGGTGLVSFTAGNFLTATSTSALATSKAAPAGTVVGTSDVQILTNKSLTSPTLTGVPIAPTATPTNNSTQVATTAYVDTADLLNVHLTGSETIGGVKTFTNGVQITPMAPPTYSAGLVYYDNTNDALTFYNSDANVALNIGQESWIKVTNNSGSSIANGTPVYINGQVSNMPTILPGISNTQVGAGIAGVTTETIANGATGFITTEGLVRNVNTSAFTAGATVYLGSTAGTLVSTIPVSPLYITKVGTVVVSNATTGVILVQMQTPWLFTQQGAGTDLLVGLAALGVRASGAAMPIATSGAVRFTGGISLSNQSPVVSTVLTLASAPYQMCSAASGNINITLPATTVAAYFFTIKKIDASANTVTLIGTVDGVVNPVLTTQNKYIKVLSTTTSGVWYTVGNN